MGRKLNPTWRADVARRAALPHCWYCHKATRGLSEYEHPLQPDSRILCHHSCFLRLLARCEDYMRQQADAIAARKAAHVAIHDWWLRLTPLAPDACGGEVRGSENHGAAGAGEAGR